MSFSTASQTSAQSRPAEESRAAVDVIEFVRSLCLRLVVNELTQARYEGEFDQASAPAGSAEEGRIAKQLAEFLRRRSAQARKSLDAAFRVADEHLAAQELRACVGVLAGRLAKSVGEQLELISSTLGTALAAPAQGDNQRALARALDAAKRAGFLLNELSGVGREHQQEADRANLSRVLLETLSLWCGEEGAGEMAGRVGSAVTVACSPSSLKAAFLTILQHLSKEGGDTGVIEVECQAEPGEVLVDFRHEGVPATEGSVLFSLDLARRIVTSYGGKMSVDSETSGSGVICHVTLPVCAGSLE